MRIPRQRRAAAISPQPTRTFYGLIDSNDRQLLGLMFYMLLLAQKSWTYRRVETFAVGEERRFRRQMSIDFEIPPWAITVAKNLGLSNLPVPIMLLKKEPLVAFDLRDASDRSIPTLTREQNGALSMAALEAALAEVKDLAVSELKAKVKSVVMDSESSAQDLVNCLPPRKPSEHEGDGLEKLRWAISTLDTRFVLVADMPLDALRGRTILKAAFEEETVGSQYAVSGGEDKQFWKRLRARMGLMDYKISFMTPEISSCQSYHFEIRPPAGIDCSKVQLLLNKKIPSQKEVRTVQGARGGSIRHLTASRELEDHQTSQSLREYEVECAFRPSLDGFLLATYWIGLAATACLGFGIHFAAQLDSRPTDPAVTLMLVLPGLIATYLVRPGEHVLASRLLRGVRVLTLVPGASLILAAAALAVHPSSGALSWEWFVLFLLSALFLVIQGVICDRARVLRPPEKPEGDLTPDVTAGQ